MAVRVNLDRAAVQRTPQELVLPLVRKVGIRVEKDAKRTVRVKTGEVRGSIRSSLRTTRSKVTWTVGAYHRRAMLEHQGSPPHDIDQKPGGPILTFYWERVGRVVHFSHVNHPGTRGSRYLENPLVKWGTRNGFRVKITNI